MNAVIQTPPTPLVGVGRNVIFRTRGYAHGPVVRMVSPSDVGKMIKPFVFYAGGRRRNHRVCDRRWSKCVLSSSRDISGRANLASIRAFTCSSVCDAGIAAFLRTAIVSPYRST